MSIQNIVDELVKEGLKNTSHGSWFFYFNEIQRKFDLILSDTVIMQLVNALNNRKEVLEVEVDEDLLNVYFSGEFFEEAEY